MTFVPRVTRTKHRPSAGILQWAQEQADAAYARIRLGSEGMETQAMEICASNVPVAPHRDTEGTLPGMRIYGLVLRSDGHRLHSDALHAAGVAQGLPLSPGDLYEIDPFDRHWTTVPEGSRQCELIFSVHIMHPDGRSHQKLAHDMWWTVLKASIDAMREAKAA